MFFGSNYTHFAPSQGEANQFGVVQLYHQNTQRIVDQLGQMRLGVMPPLPPGVNPLPGSLIPLTAVKIPLFLVPQEAPYVANGFSLELIGSRLDDQRMQNLSDLFKAIAGQKFEHLEISFLPWTLQGIPWERLANFTMAVRTLAYAQAPNLKILFDLGEFIPRSDQPEMRAYAQNWWAWYTTAFWPGKPVGDATISFVPDPDIISNLATVFKGPDQNGPVNPPTVLEPHVYGSEAIRGWGSAYTVLLNAMGLVPHMHFQNTPVRIGETYSFKDLTTLSELNRGALDLAPAWNVEGILQWSMLRPSTNDEQDSPPLCGALLT